METFLVILGFGIAGYLLLMLIVVVAVYSGPQGTAEDMARGYALIHGCVACGRILPEYCYSTYCAEHWRSGV